MDDGVPLPGALSGTVNERIIRLDDALFYLVAGALQFIADYQEYEQTGALTVDQARDALSQMIWDFYTRSAVQIGTTVIWPAATIPDLWLRCDGTVKLQSNYPELHGLIGATWNTGGEPGNAFRLPNLQNRFPVGAVPKSLAAIGGQEDVTLIENQLPAHSHSLNFINGSGGQASRMQGGNLGTASVSTTAIPASGGGGLSHTNMPPYVVVYFIIKALP